MARSARKTTIATVARSAGRSISTVSAALNNAPGVAPATREEIVRIAAELGYEADPRARLLRAARTGVIGVSYYLGQAFQAELIDALYRAAELHGLGLALAASTPRHGEVEGLRALVRDRCEAIIVVDSLIPYGELRAVVGGLPLLYLCRESPSPEVRAVRSTDEAAMHDLVDHLVSTGRRHIVHVDGGESPSRDLRAHAYVEAMARHGLRARILPGGSGEEAGIAAIEQLAGEGEFPEGILFFNDHAAIGALLELRRRAIRVPEDVAIAGFDGIAITGLSAVDLTTVRQDVDRIAETAIRHLAGVLSDASESRKGADLGGARGSAEEAGSLLVSSLEAVPTRLVVRGSTAIE
ncbi:substrate-binding domain-containing protein [Schaalia hyovaginalis]|uniref:DNA-binding LacI/PurR family transcriptional regulator n=1 Tax=Schaalia hyovaginalis TaxID=29316 RepID=A0A923E3G9_9ACTO|nr:DNA-binding LacI/PurR family transcriptional regulator [Schaalia hyovaginalis]